MNTVKLDESKWMAFSGVLALVAGLFIIGSITLMAIGNWKFAAIVAVAANACSASSATMWMRLYIGKQ